MFNAAESGGFHGGMEFVDRVPERGGGLFWTCLPLAITGLQLGECAWLCCGSMTDRSGDVQMVWIGEIV